MNEPLFFGKEAAMKNLCLLTLFIGITLFSFGTSCLIFPVLGYRSEFDTVGRLSLDEIGVYIQVAGAIFWGISMVALSIDSKNNKSD